MSGAVAADCSDSPWKEAGWGHHVGESELALSPLLAQHQDVWLSKGPLLEEEEDRVLGNLKGWLQFLRPSLSCFCRDSDF